MHMRNCPLLVRKAVPREVMRKWNQVEIFGVETIVPMHNDFEGCVHSLLAMCLDEHLIWKTMEELHLYRQELLYNELTILVSRG